MNRLRHNPSKLFNRNATVAALLPLQRCIFERSPSPLILAPHFHKNPGFARRRSSTRSSVLHGHEHNNADPASTQTSQVTSIQMNELERLITKESKDYVLLDVRNPHETKLGIIPTARVISLSQIPEAFDANVTSDEEFEDRYEFRRPALTQRVIFYCRSGVRSEVAGKLVCDKGYRWVQNYVGSWLEWSANHEQR